MRALRAAQGGRREVHLQEGLAHQVPEPLVRPALRAVLRASRISSSNRNSN